jgi:hypothetical protein
MKTTKGVKLLYLLTQYSRSISYSNLDLFLVSYFRTQNRNSYKTKYNKSMTTSTTRTITEIENSRVPIQPFPVQMRLPSGTRLRKRRKSKTYLPIAELLKDDSLLVNCDVLLDGENTDKFIESVHPHDCPFYQSY